VDFENKENSKLQSNKGLTNVTNKSNCSNIKNKHKLFAKPISVNKENNKNLINTLTNLIKCSNNKHKQLIVEPLNTYFEKNSGIALI